MAVGRIEKGLNGAEVALESTSTGKFDQSNRQVALALEDRSIRTDGALGTFVRSIDDLIPIGAEIINDLRQQGFEKVEFTAGSDSFSEGKFEKS